MEREGRGVMGPVRSVGSSLIVLLLLSGCQADSERLVWKYETYHRGWLSGDCSCAAPVIASDTLYFCGGYIWEDKEQLVAVDLGTHREKWKIPMPRSCGPLKVKDGVIYKWDDRRLAALDANTGRPLWHRDDVSGLPFFYGHQPYVALKDRGALEQVDSATGRTVTSVRVSDVPDGDPLLEADALYYGTRAGDICVVDLKSASQLLARKVADRVTTPLAKVGGAVFFGAASVDPQTRRPSFRFYALELSPLTMRWVVDGRTLTQARPLVFDGKVFFGDAMLYAIDLVSGSARVDDISRGPGGNPVVSGGVLYVAGGRYMHALDPGSGRLLWRYRTGGWVDAPPTGPPPVVHHGRIYFCSLDCAVYALRT